MEKQRTFFKSILAALVAVSLFVNSPALASSGGGKGGHADAQKGQQTASILPVIGAVTIAIGVAMVAAENYAGFIFIAMGIAEVAGGMAAAGNNAQTVEDTKSDSGPTGSGSSAGGPEGYQGTLPGGMTMAEVCAKAAGVCSCSGADCTKPKLDLPANLDEIKAGMQKAFDADPNAFGGKSLADALSDLDNNFANAQLAANKFNAMSDKGAFGGGSGGGGKDANNSLLADNGDLQGLKGKNENSGNGSNAVSGDGTNGDGSGKTNTPANAMANGLNSANSIRDSVRAVTRRPGLLLEDERTGRLLTIFERVSRAIRGANDRDLTLAKIEWARKELAKKDKKNQKKSNTVAAKFE